MDDQQFTATVWEYYHSHGRDLPWRRPESDGTFEPYKILVSEVMLQQTQAARVIPKYQQFLALFPTIEDLAAAPLADVLRAWSGLGYNRRAKFLWQSADTVVTNHRGSLPNSQATLATLPGIGLNTAGAILAYAYNKPVAFIETNIRTVYIHHFFADQADITDTQILAHVARTLPTNSQDTRTWYWALMDYGAFLKATVGNRSQSSRNYSKQSAFAGSRRQIRGQVLRQLVGGPQTLAQLHKAIADARLESVLSELCSEQLIHHHKGVYTL